MTYVPGSMTSKELGRILFWTLSRNRTPRTRPFKIRSRHERIPRKMLKKKR